MLAELFCTTGCADDDRDTGTGEDIVASRLTADVESDEELGALPDGLLAFSMVVPADKPGFAFGGLSVTLFICAETGKEFAGGIANGFALTLILFR